MKILCISDTHFRKLRPRHRLDSNYLATQIEKWAYIENYAIEHGIKVIAHGGDITDAWDQSDSIKEAFFNSMLSTQKICVFGQHDLRNHKYQTNTSLGVIIASKRMMLANDRPIYFLSESVSFYGASWGEEIPEIVTPDDFNCLLIHRMIIDGDKVWEGQEKFVAAKNLLTDTKFDLIVSGDNHQTFVCQVGEQTLINSGSMMRAKVNQKDHKPCFFVYDTSTRTYEQVFIPCKPAYEVLNLDKVEELEEQNERLQAFTEALASDDEISGIDLEENLRQEIQTNEEVIEEGVIDITWEIVEMAKKEMK